MPDSFVQALPEILLVVIVIAIIVLVALLNTFSKAGEAFTKLADEIASARSLFDASRETCKSCGGDGEVVKENPLLKSIRKAIDAGVKS